jgi:uncharacterized protein (TIGR00299 family) protein
MIGSDSETVAYLDCFSGISGDMLLGALLDAGLPEKVLLEELRRLPLEDYTIASRRMRQGALQGTKVDIAVGANQPQRSWREIRALLAASGLAPGTRKKALRVFGLLAAAEGKVHGCPPDEVHFHEVGGVDAIIDIVGGAIGLEYFGVEKVVSSALPLPRGWVDSAHGPLPMPAPAVCELLQGVPVHGEEVALELVTPTGAALAKGLSERFGSFPAMIIEKVGYGAGSHELPGGRPNLLRLVLGKQRAMEEAQEVEVIETHLDDWSPEGYPYLSEVLFEQGALDVAAIPLQMKKGRPGLLIRVVAPPAAAWELKRCLLSETTAIGLRFRREQRWTLPREAGTVATSWGPLQVKRVETPAGPRLRPEFEDCRRLAMENGVPLAAIYAEAEGKTQADFRPTAAAEEEKERP